MVTLLTLIITFSVLVILENIVGTELQKTMKHDNTIDQFTGKDFFLNNFSEKRTMFLLGSSQVQFINIAQVNNLIDEDILIYNLAITSDTPVDRINQLEKIISVTPEIIFYGISYRDFQIPYQEDVFPSIKKIKLCSLSSYFPSNPKLLTIDLIQKVAPKEILKEKEEQHIFENAPFVEYNTDITIPRDLEYDKRLEAITQEWKDECILYQNIFALNSIISELQKNDIKIVIFTTPLHKFYLESLSDYQKNKLDELLKELSKKYDIKIYEFEEKYSELNMWRDHMHISFHESVTKYNEDIASMIIKESEK
jgi:hypothetical protein